MLLSAGSIAGHWVALLKSLIQKRLSNKASHVYFPSIVRSDLLKRLFPGLYFLSTYTLSMNDRSPPARTASGAIKALIYVGPRMSATFSASDVSRYDSILDVSDSTTYRFV